MRPPRLPLWLLGRVIPPGPMGDTIGGDLLEDFSHRAQRSRAAASLWYWRAVLSILFRYRRPGWTSGSAPRQRLREALVQGLDAAYPPTNRGWRVRVVPLTDYIVGDARQTLLLLLGAVGLVMLVACANVANLFLAHAAGRHREIAVRSAIGAPRGRIFRQVLTESLLLSALAGALGILIGRWGLQLLIAIGASDIPRLEQASLDRTVLLFSIGVSVATGILFGLLPALQLSRSNLVQALREGTRGAGTRGRTRKILVVAEVAIALVLLVAAGLLGRSFRGLQQLDVGFQPANLLAMRVTLSGPKYRQPGPDVVYYSEAIKRISAVPSVQSAAAVLALPVGGGGFYLGRGFICPGLNHPAEGYNSGFQTVTPGYFSTLGVPLLKGRDFDAHDTAASAPVVVINRTLADRFLGVPAALGAAHLLGRLLYGVGPGDPLTFAGVIAVIAGVTWISAYIPARRATRVDPAIVLRGD